MPITYDLETDIRFLQGIEKAKMEDVEALLKSGELSTDFISTHLKVPIEEVERIKKDMELDTGSSDDKIA